MREDPRLHWLGRAEPVIQLSEELGVSSAMLGSLLAEAAQVAAEEQRDWAERERRARDARRAEGVTVEERLALLG